MQHKSERILRPLRMRILTWIGMNQELVNLNLVNLVNQELVNLVNFTSAVPV